MIELTESEQEYISYREEKHNEICKAKDDIANAIVAYYEAVTKIINENTSMIRTDDNRRLDNPTFQLLIDTSWIDDFEMK